MPVCCLADGGQPNAHTPEPMHPFALRRRYPCDHPSRSAPRRATAAFSPTSSGATSATESRCSTRSKQGRRESSSSSSPNSVRQRSSTRDGVRKQVPELINVVPPRPLPSGSPIGGLPTVAVPAELARALRTVVAADRGQARRQRVSGSDEPQQRSSPGPATQRHDGPKRGALRLRTGADQLCERIGDSPGLGARHGLNLPAVRASIFGCCGRRRLRATHR